LQVPTAAGLEVVVDVDGTTLAAARSSVAIMPLKKVGGERLVHHG